MDTNRDLCPDCGHDGYDGHDMRTVPPACLSCRCGSPLYYPTLDTVEDVEAWIRSWTPLGGFPHPDDSAWLTCEEMDRLGYQRSHQLETDHALGGHLSIVGPGAPTTKTDALAYDEARNKAVEIILAAGLDIYTMVLDEMAEHEDDGSVTVTVTLTFRPDENTGVLDRTDVIESLKARLDEVYVGRDDWPVTPEVEVIGD